MSFLQLVCAEAVFRRAIQLIGYGDIKSPLVLLDKRVQQLLARVPGGLAYTTLRGLHAANVQQRYFRRISPGRAFVSNGAFSRRSMTPLSRKANP